MKVEGEPSIVMPSPENVSVTLTLNPWPWKPDQFLAQL